MISRYIVKSICGSFIYLYKMYLLRFTACQALCRHGDRMLNKTDMVPGMYNSSYILEDKLL